MVLIVVLVVVMAVLMLVPTRELALQTSAIVKEIGRHMDVQCMVSTGGTTLKDDIMRLYKVVHILVSGCCFYYYYYYNTTRDTSPTSFS